MIMANVSQKWLNGKELNVLSFFSRGNNIKIHGNELAKKLEMPQRTIMRNLDLLNKLGVLKFVRIGKNKTYSLNLNSPVTLTALITAESWKTVNFLIRNPKIAILLDEIKCGVIIFGSYARGDNKENSDLDIVFLCERKHIKKILDKFSIEIHPQFVSLTEFEKKIIDKDALALEILKDHILFQEIERLSKMMVESDKDG